MKTIRTSAAVKRSLALLSIAGLLLCSGSARAYQISSFFDITYDLSQGPPYPPINGVVASVGTSNLPFAPIEKVSLKFKNVTPEMQTRIVGSDSGGGLGSPGVNSFFDVFMDVPMMISSFFDIFTEVSTVGGAPLPIAGTPTVVWHTDSFFDVFWEADVPGQERQFVQMSFRVPEGQSVKFIEPDVGPYRADSFFDVFLEVVNHSRRGPDQPGVAAVPGGDDRQLRLAAALARARERRQVPPEPRPHHPWHGRARQLAHQQRPGHLAGG